MPLFSSAFRSITNPRLKSGRTPAAAAVAAWGNSRRRGQQPTVVLTAGALFRSARSSPVAPDLVERAPGRQHGSDPLNRSSARPFSRAVSSLTAKLQINHRITPATSLQGACKNSVGKLKATDIQKTPQRPPADSSTSATVVGAKETPPVMLHRT